MSVDSIMLRWFKVDRGDLRRRLLPSPLNSGGRTKVGVCDEGTCCVSEGELVTEPETLLLPLEGFFEDFLCTRAARAV